ncbi:MAG TPA: CaiB/BaiF CoA-transferase family protein [Acidimicrobiales bacterium]|jgi:crotonobetainyl-CoA:carnitine CoA-transferase CaiB-like acyl-CoA transferase
MSDVAGGPLRGIRVIDVGTRISAPFCAGLLGELGADVIKVELPGEGDFMRTMGPFVPVEDGPDYSLSWSVEGRGRRGVTCDLRHPEGKELFKRLVATADVLCENFRPGTMERWGLGPDDLPEDLVLVRISVFGQSGPYAPRPGLDRLGIAFGGLLHLTGEPDRPPVRPGVTISDYLTGTFAAFAAVAALYGRDASGGRSGSGDAASTGSGEVIDAPLYGAILRVLEWTLAGYDRLGIVRQREGNRLSHSAPLDNYPTADGFFVCVVAGSDANFSRLCAAMDRPDLLSDPRFGTLAERAAHGDEINGIVTAWTSSLTADEITTRCVEHDVPVGTAYSAADIFADPHMEARGDLVPIEDPVIGAVRQQAPFPRLTKHPGTVPVGAPRLGEHNKEVWCGLVGLSEAELEDLTARGVV